MRRVPGVGALLELWWYVCHGHRMLATQERNWQQTLKVNAELATALRELREATQYLTGDVYLYGLGEITYGQLYVTQGQVEAVLRETDRVGVSA